MPSYYVDLYQKPAGGREVHTTGCPHPPSPENRRELGTFNTCHAAILEARKHYEDVDGCAHCCRECHTR